MRLRLGPSREAVDAVATDSGQQFACLNGYFFSKVLFDNRLALRASCIRDLNSFLMIETKLLSE